MALPNNGFDSFDLESLNFESKIKAKPEKRPQFSIIYGKGGIGKTTAACYSIDPIILPVGRETGHERMCVPKFPSFSEMNLTPVQHVFASLSWLLQSQHTRKTLIIDNVGSYREVVDEDVEESNKGVDLKAYGRGAALAYPYWTRLLAGIDALMKRREMNVILLGHDGSFNVNLPDGTYYQKISVNAPRGENTQVMGLLEARCHNMFYLRGEDQVVTDKRGVAQQGKKYATSGLTKRIIYTKSRGDFFAKSRVNMEEYYEIDNSETEEDLLQNRTNETLIKFWQDVYK